jgi:hypothetical protein
MGTSRDANDPRDELRAMNKQARGEFEREQESDTGGQEHASRADREAVPAERREVEAATRDTSRTTRAQDDEGALRVPRGDAATGGGGGRTAGPIAQPPSVDRDEPG